MIVDNSYVDRLLQEILMDSDPSGWRMLCGCILLNQTGRNQVDAIISELFERWGSPHKMSHADIDSLAELLKPCGLQKRKADTLIKFSAQYCDKSIEQWDAVESMSYYGIGEYARDSYRIFRQGRLSNDAKDKELMAFIEDALEWKRRGVYLRELLGLRRRRPIGTYDLTPRGSRVALELTRGYMRSFTVDSASNALSISSSSARKWLNTLEEIGLMQISYRPGSRTFLVTPQMLDIYKVEVLNAA